MKYFEDEDFIKKQLNNSKVQNISGLLKRYFIVKDQTTKE